MSSTFKGSSCHDRPPQSFPLHLLESTALELSLAVSSDIGFRPCSRSTVSLTKITPKNPKTRIRLKRVQITAPPTPLFTDMFQSFKTV